MLSTTAVQKSMAEVTMRTKSHIYFVSLDQFLKIWFEKALPEQIQQQMIPWKKANNGAVSAQKESVL